MGVMSTGIPKLDELIGGGLEKGSCALIYMTPGLEGMVFAQQMLLEILKKGGMGLYFVNNKMPESVLQSVERLNWRSELFRKMKFIDCFSATAGQASGHRYFVKEPWSLKATEEVIARAVKENCGGMLVFDSFSSVVERNGEKEALEAQRAWKEVAKENGVTSVYLFTDWGGEGRTFERISKPFDYVIRLQAVEEKMLLRNYFVVTKAPKPASRSAVPFKIGTEGVAVYVPKILVTGPFHSGKSSFIQAISTRAVSVDRLGTTIALDHGYVDYGGMNLDLFGTPGQERFTFMIDILNRDVFGIILIVDSVNPEFDRAVEMLKYVSRYGIPAVVAANKQDLRGAKRPEEVKRELVKRGIPQDTVVVGTSAVTKKGCLDAVKALVDKIVVVEGA